MSVPTPSQPLEDIDLETRVRHAQPVLWCNPSRLATAPEQMQALGKSISQTDMLAAAARFGRFAPFLARRFPELQASQGRVESALLPADALFAALGHRPDQGRLWIKADHQLAVAGSIKARGGFHEVLEWAEQLAAQAGLLEPGTDYAVLAEAPARALFGQYQVAVGSTGNLGMSIGIMAAALGFQAVVHMSAEAKAWKKQRLRDHGVQVIEHAGDYEAAVASGRAQALANPRCHFVDDERSPSLLLGYSSAALHLRRQLEQAQIVVDAEHPLLVYLPCGVGGAPAGISFGLRQLFGDAVHCFFAEPVQSPCFLLQMMQGLDRHPSVYDLGLNNRTEADGLAVPRASRLAAELMQPLLSGVYTVTDATLFEHLVQVLDHTGLRIEPSAAAGFSGPGQLLHSASGHDWLERHGLRTHLAQATHLVWTTGGRLLPAEEFQRFEQRGRQSLARDTPHPTLESPP